jgi:hypothetical protein
MKIRALYAALIVVLLLPSGVFAQTVPSAPEGATVPIADICPIAVVTIVTVDGSDRRATTGQTFRAILSSPDGPGVASGSLWVNASGVPYHIPFERRHVLSNALDGPIDPIVFRLPQTANLENAFVDTLDNPTPGPCRITSAWAPMYTQRLKLDLLKKFDVPSTAAVIAAKLILDPVTECHSPPFPPTTLFAMQIFGPRTVGSKGDEVNVLIDLAADSSVRSAEIMRTTNVSVNTSAIEAAKGSQFRTEIVNCRPISSKYVFVVEYPVR